MGSQCKFEALMPCECSFPLDRFAGLFRVFLVEGGETIQIEGEGVAIRKKDFADLEEVVGFVRRVCHWGGYDGIAARVTQRNRHQEIADVFRKAAGILESPTSDSGAALARVMKLKDLGVSFGSKHLRFLFPEMVPVLDRIVSERLYYPMSPDGYRSLTCYCTRVATMLTQERVEHPLLQREGRWFVADVEASLYAYLKGWAGDICCDHGLCVS